MPDCSKEDEGRDANGNRRFEGRRFVGPTDVFQWQPTNRHVLAHFAQCVVLPFLVSSLAPY